MDLLSKTTPVSTGDEALNIHNYCQDVFPGMPISLTYNQPNYRIKIGARYEKLNLLLG